MIYRERDVARFWTKVQKGEPNECWLWQSGLNGKGYGTFGFWDQRSVGAHRYSYFIHKGDIPNTKEVRHTCDVRACVNPNHLIIGTHKQNMEDMVERGRARNGNTFKTHCVHGHPFNAENTIYRSNGKHRKCKICVQLKVKFRKQVKFQVPIQQA